MNHKKIILIVLAIALLATNAFAQNDKSPFNFKIKEFELDNGLRVIFHQDKSTPLVAVNIWYHVGSKNETYGKTGYAHLFEHMMFQGSKFYNNDYGEPIQEAGGSINGSTNFDRTRFFQVVPSNFLEMVLYLEAGRMGTLLDVTNQARLDNQREIVKNEYRERVENRPYGSALEKVHKLIYPKTHPYHWLAAGSIEDLSKATLDDAKKFFKTFYIPNNASLVIAGDFDEKQAETWIRKYFSNIKRGKKVKRPNPKPPKIKGEIRKTYKEDVSVARQFIVWHTPPATHKDSITLSMLRSILTPRIRENIVRKNRLAQNIRIGNFRQEISGRFFMEMNVGDEKSLEEVVKQVDLEVEKIKNTPPTEMEVLRQKRSNEAELIYDLQTILDKANSFNYNAIFKGTPNTFQKQLDAILSVTPKDIQRVAKKYLNKNRLIMRIVPGKVEKKSAVSNNKNKASEKAKPKEQKDESYKLPKPTADPKFSLPPIQKKKLSNGLDVWVIKQDEVPVVSMNLILKSGGTANPDGKEGLSSAVSDFIGRGTKKRTGTEISNQVDLIGARFSANARWDSTNIEMLALTKYFDEALDIYADSITNPVFSDEEVKRQKPRWTNRIRQQKRNPQILVDLIFYQLVYGKNHPYGKSFRGTEDSIKSITKDDLANFYKTFYRPNNGTLLIVGDVEMSSLIPKLEKVFANWKSAKVPEVNVPKPSNTNKPGIYIVDKPGAVQSSISMGKLAVSRNNSDFETIQVLNRILGGQYTSRINLNLRADKGYAFGARTRFTMRRDAGNFLAFSDVRTNVTKESVVEMIKEVNGIGGAIPLSKKELNFGKQGIIRGFPRTVETVEQVSGRLADSVLYDLPDTFFNSYLTEVGKVKTEDIYNVAKKYLNINEMKIVVVGDRKIIEPKLKEIKGFEDKIFNLDEDGNIIK